MPAPGSWIGANTIWLEGNTEDGIRYQVRELVRPAGIRGVHRPGPLGFTVVFHRSRHLGPARSPVNH